MSTTPRAKYQDSGSPGEFRSSLPQNPRKDYDDPSARPSGRSGGGEPVSTPHRVSSSSRRPGGRAGAKQKGRRRG